ncbi:GNAT family N-acetyltransferase [Pseudahrensia aquimaris]|uniref:GNAT family N-acetyltransferase n=1 Tax=Pseudahrensia aquimaris TaxID=744461 RepID=A0ABW3FG09_9HYPH
MSDTMRRPRADECDHITGLCLNSKRSLGYDEAFMAQCEDELTVTPGDLENAEFWGLDRDGQLIGVGALRLDLEKREGEIKTFFIAPDLRGSGVGRLIWAQLLERAGAHGLKRLTLTSEPLSTGFYEKLGFAVIGQEPSGSIEGRFLPLMELKLGERTSA